MTLLTLMCLLNVVKSEVYYIESSSNGQCIGKSDHCLTFSQYVRNSSVYLANDTSLIFSSGNHSLDTDFVVKNIHSFSMFVQPTLKSSKAVIICDNNTRFEFRNASIVAMRGIEFVGCLENCVVSVGQFRVQNSRFHSRNNNIIAHGTILTIDDSTATLDTVTIERVQTFHEFETSKDCKIATVDYRMIGVLIRKSIVNITQSWFEGNNVGLGGVIYAEFGSELIIFNTTFLNNSAVEYCSSNYSCCSTGGIVRANRLQGNTVKLYHNKFVQNVGVLILISGDSMVYATYTNLIISHSTLSHNTGQILEAKHTNVSISHSNFFDNDGSSMISVADGIVANIDYSKFINNTGLILQALNTSVSVNRTDYVSNNLNQSFVAPSGIISSFYHNTLIHNSGSWIFWLEAWDSNMINIAHNEFTENSVTCSVVYFYGGEITLSLNEFITNRAYNAVVELQYTTAETLANNVFIDNRAAYEVYIRSFVCRSGYSISLSSSHCIKCNEHWHRNLIGIVIAAFVAGIALVFIMLALNMTVAVGTLNGILFYANILPANADTFFASSTTPNFVSVFVSWLNFDIGFDVCFSTNNNEVEAIYTFIYKPLLQLAFPAYLILLVIIVIVISEHSSKFAELVGKGNPVAVLATMILLAYARFCNVIRAAFSLAYGQPAYGSQSIDIARLDVFANIESYDTKFKTLAYSSIAFVTLIVLSGIVYFAVVFSWQWLLMYQHKAIFKWVRYQKLRHSLEPYHAPYTTKYRYWTGLLLFVRIFLGIISALNFSLNPRVDLLSIILVVGGLILLKGVIAKRVYKDWPLDVMEIAIYFNLVAFSAFTWYNLDTGGNQTAVAYISVMIIFIFLLGVIVFHVLRYTRLYKYSVVEKAFKWMSSKVMEKKPKQKASNLEPDELDGYQLERSGDQGLTYSTVELHNPAQNEEETDNTTLND